ncbi:ParB/RepB/Spo0J family partition protein [Phytohalomonas tamaricis]|uniref:ParB/RepB/Spo0J family partition protein n=1 Tax=Phytohalomonas tamaricis TaxID=2081032 RepID=UPI000D0AE440|nr:ParB/RepB/Spo0J family partition protein [Phytohalomonas tamaricis]
MTRKRALGRGLDALIGAGAKQRTVAPVAIEDKATSTRDSSADVSIPDAPGFGGEVLMRLPLGQMTRGKYQPRRDIQPERLEELAASIRARGVMQPIVVRPIVSSGNKPRYEIIAGERRWRAAQLADLDVIPAVVRELDDETALAMALIENIQRENLNPIEETLALKRLMDEFELTQQQVADAVGKSRAQIANLLRLLALEDEVQTLLERGDLDVGHARALLALKGVRQRHAARDVVAKDLTVRQTEALVKRLTQGETKGGEVSPPADVGRLEMQLAELLGAQVKIDHGKAGKGRLTIRYTSLDELDGILAHIR